MLAEDPDICCLQELKCEKAKIPDSMQVKGYHCYWLAGSTKGYAGVGLMSKVEPLEVTYELEEKKFADEGRTLIAEYDKFFLINSCKQVANANAWRWLLCLIICLVDSFKTSRIQGAL